MLEQSSRRNLIIAGLMLLSGAVAFADPTLAQRSFDKLRKDPGIQCDCFDFIVVGDTRSLKPLQQSDAFQESIKEFNALNPAFVVDVGDLILGGAAEGLKPQWDEFLRVTNRCQPPFFPVPGNHDISDAASERIYTNRVGPTWYAFTYGNSRFIMLDSEEVGQAEGLSDAQIDRLKQDLASTDATNIFLFLHKPYFLEDWDSGWAKVAQAIKGYPVKVVFASHEHLYRDLGMKDGVHYVVTGGGGAEVRTPTDEGGFHHYLLVHVRGDRVSWAVIKPGNVLPSNCVTSARVDEIEAARTKWVRTDHIEVPYGAPFAGPVAVHITNPTDNEAQSNITWDVPDGWTVAPTRAEYKVPAHETGDFTFKVATKGNAPAHYPVPTLHTQYVSMKHGGPIDVTRRLDYVPLYNVKHAPGPVTIDGDLSDWDEAPSEPVPYAWKYNIHDTKDLDAHCRFMWDDKNFYLAVEVKDDEFYQPYAGDIVWSADGVQLFINGDWEWGLTLTTNGAEVFLYRGVNREEETVNTTVNLAIKKKGGHLVYEAAFPKSELTPIQLKPGTHFTFSMAVNDKDPSHPDRPRHWAELTPGVGNAIPGSPMATLVLKKTKK